MKENYSIKLKCVFCGSTNFEFPEEDYQPSDGEMIKCSNCGRLNDFSSVRDLAQKEGIDIVKNEFTKEIKDILKKSIFKIK